MALEIELPTPVRAVPLGGREPSAPPAARALSPLSGLAAGLAGAFAVLLAAALLVVFAATLALVLILAAAVLTSAALAFKFGRRRARVVRLGHSWVVYGLEPRA